LLEKTKINEKEAWDDPPLKKEPNHKIKVKSMRRGQNQSLLSFLVHSKAVKFELPHLFKSTVTELN